MYIVCIYIVLVYIITPSGITRSPKIACCSSSNFFMISWMLLTSVGAWSLSLSKSTRMTCHGAMVIRGEPRSNVS